MEQLQMNLDQKMPPHLNGASKESAADILTDAVATKAPAAADLLAQPEVKAAINAAYNKVPAWLKVVLLIAGAIGIGPILSAYMNAQALWGLPDKYTAEITEIKTEQGKQRETLTEQGEQLDRIEDAIDKLAKGKAANEDR